MTDKTTTKNAVMTGKTKIITLWLLRILVAALFFLTASMKLSGQPMMIENFDMVGLGQWFRYFTGVLEVMGAVAVLVPVASVMGAVLLLLVDIGAFFAQAFILHMDIIHTIVIGLVISALIFLQRKQLFDFLRRL
ncbi:MAG: DoxX family protein [Bradyrhizobium sp.]